MKILIVSDSHGKVSALRTAVKREQPDRVFHLGDVNRDAERLAEEFPTLLIDAVVGNCDGWATENVPDQLVVTVGGVKFFLTHGHRYHVKMGIGMVVNEGKNLGADVVCFGHTHQAMHELWTGGIWVVNPGSAGGVYAPATYAVAEAENGKVSVMLKKL